MPEDIITPGLALVPVTADVAVAVLDGELSVVNAGDGWPHDDTLDALRMAQTADALAWLVTLDGVVIGDCGTHGPPDDHGEVEIGFGLAAPYRGRGYGTELVGGLCRWLLEQPGIRRVTAAHVALENLAARRVLEHAGFRLERADGRQAWYALDAHEGLHSAAYLGPHRDFWWNDDYVELLARRFALGGVRSVLDLGAGVGHWGRLLAPVLSPEALVIGVDSEPRWVQEATRRAQSAGLGGRYSYQQGAAETLPFDDGAFDLVTCQTLLIHVPDVGVVIGEMVRVTRPGGLVLVAEPNNGVWMLAVTSSDAGEDVEERTEAIRFYLICERGKAALGKGDNSVGDLLPNQFRQAGLTEIRAYLNDKAWLMVPPYETDEQRVMRSELVDEVRRGRWVWSREEALSYFLAGGGSEAEFDTLWHARLRKGGQIADDLAAERYHTGGGGIHYVIAGRKPRP